MQTDNSIKINRLLTPLSFLYGIGVKIRDLLFSWNILPCEKYPIPVISIGNLSAGGTGKTPHTEYLIRLLKNDYRIAVLSRGYKRKRSGFVLASSTCTYKDIGDEPFQMLQKFPDILIAVDANRRRGIQKLLSLPEQQRPEVILLDDAFQHRYVVPSLSIVLTDYNRLFYYDKLLPAGRLREPADRILRADMVVVTKCKEAMTPLEFRIIEENMHLMAHQKLFFSHILYEDLKPLYPKEAPSKSLRQLKHTDHVLLLSGIASPGSFVQKIKEHTDNVTVMNFPDHHAFTKHDFRNIQNVCDKTSYNLILVTEKDASRLLDNPLMPEEWKQSLYYLPIRIDFGTNKRQQFDNMIKKHIQSYEQQNRNLNIR